MTQRLHAEAARSAKLAVIKQRQVVEETSHLYMRQVVVVGLLAVISAIFIMPGVALPKTTLDAQQVADQVFWLLASAVPELLVNFLPSQFSGASLFDTVSILPHGRPAVPVVLIC